MIHVSLLSMIPFQQFGLFLSNLVHAIVQSQSLPLLVPLLVPLSQTSPSSISKFQQRLGQDFISAGQFLQFSAGSFIPFQQKAVHCHTS